MKNRKGLTMSIIFRAESANYGEGYNNISVLKKMSREDYNEYTYISRQALRYNMIQQLKWDNTPVSEKQSVVQFAPSATIKDYPEIDLFGYMKTTKAGDNNEDKGSSNTRSAVVRLSNAISLEPYNGDMDYLTNMGLAKRENFGNAIAQSEIHSSYYAYTIAIDLDKVGIDGNIEIENKEKAHRINDFLDVVEYLYRDIRGRRENLAPLFAIGGVYNRKNPYFEHRLNVKSNTLNIDTLINVMEDEDVKRNTHIGLIKGIFSNEEEINERLNPVSVKEVFDKIKKEVNEYFS